LPGSSPIAAEVTSFIAGSGFRRVEVDQQVGLLQRDGDDASRMGPSETDETATPATPYPQQAFRTG
jgi:hypothetical protein